MNWFSLHRHSAALVLLTLLVPAGLFLYAVLGLLSQRAAYQSEIERLQPRIARLQGLIASEEALTTAAAQMDARLNAVVYPGTEERAAVEASLQKEVRTLLANAGLSTSNSQVLPQREAEGLEQLLVRLRVSGSLEALDRFLGDLQGYQPLILVESIDIAPERQSRRRNASPRQELDINLQLMSLRAAEGE